MVVKNKRNMTRIKEPKNSIAKKSHHTRELLLLCLPALIGYLLFNYVPMFLSVTIPFRDYKFAKGVFGSEFVGLKNFEWLFSSNLVLRSIKNTALYGVWFIFIGTLTNVALALLLFEVSNRRALKVYQTTYSFPNFMAMVVVGYVVYAILSPRYGVLNQILTALGKDPIDVYMESKYWPLILTIVRIWKNVGMGSLMYFASLMSIDTALYEAAELDGATRWQRIRYISIPHLVPLMCVFVILGASSIVSGDFDLFYIIPRNVSMNYETTDILNTYVYRALKSGDYAMGATVDFVKSAVGFLLVLGSNLVVKKISPENSMF